MDKKLNDIPIYDLATELRYLEKLTELAEENERLKKEILELRLEVKYLQDAIDFAYRK